MDNVYTNSRKMLKQEQRVLKICKRLKNKTKKVQKTKLL